MRQVGKRVLLTSVAAVALQLPAVTVWAQDQAAGPVDQIVVTSSKRGAQNLQDVPGAVQAFSQDMLEDLGAVEFSDIALRIPGLTFQDQGPGDREYIIRGVNSRGTATTGVYYDEAVITARNKQDGGGRQADIELHDLERIEVLKGPQGTLYGASSMSGTIRFIPNAPDATRFEGRAEGTASTTRKGEGNYHVNGMINVPIVRDKLALRAVGWITRDGGFIDNSRLGLKDINSNDVEGVRLAAQFEPTDRLTLTASFLVQDREVGGSSRFNRGALQPNFQQLLTDNDFDVFPIADLTNQEFTVNSWDENLKLYSFKGEYNTDWGSFLATTNYFERDVLFRFDSTPILLFFGAPAAALTFQPQSREVWSNEIRFASNFEGPLQFVAGGFYMEEKKDFEVQVIAANDLGLPLGPFDTSTDFFVGPEGAAIFGRQKEDDFEQYAFFGEATFDATEDLQLLFGIRYFEAEITSAARETKPFVGFPPTDNPAFTVPADTQNKTTFKISANYQVTEDALVYVLASSGFRIGGTNDNAINPGNVDVPVTFGPDNLWNYEAGWKSAWFDDQLTLNGAAYFIRWKDIQVGDFDPSSPFPFVQNAGKAGIDGFEIEVNARPTPELNIFFGASYQNARLREDFPDGEVLGRKGDDIPNVPKFQFSGGAQYTQPVNDKIDGVARFDLAYQGSRDTLFRPNSPFNVHLDNYLLVNAKIGIEGETWQANLFVHNLTDKRAMVDAINSSQDPLAFLTVRPRTFGINASKRF